MKANQSDGFAINKVKLTENGFTYHTFRLTGRLNGQRIRKQFKSEKEAKGERSRLEVQAANTEGQIHTVLTRLSEQQVRDAETSTALLGSVPLSAAAHYLTNYKPPVAEKSLVEAKDAFIALHPGVSVGSITTAEVKTFLEARGWGPKTFNNKLGDLAAFFAFCIRAPQKWATENPVAPIGKFKITRGIPEILTVKQAADLMAYVKTYVGGPRSKLPVGCLAPYFALCLFAGLRPSVPNGEVWKLAQEKAPAKFIDLALGTIRITPAVSKVKCVRHLKTRFADVAVAHLFFRCKRETVGTERARGEAVGAEEAGREVILPGVTDVFRSRGFGRQGDDEAVEAVDFGVGRDESAVVVSDLERE